MSKKKRTDEGGDVGPENVEAFVRTAADAIFAQVQTAWPAVEVLAADSDFLRASERLAQPDVPFSTVEQLSRSTSPIVAAIADRAASLRDDVTAEWVDWAFRRLKGVYAGELEYLLRALERHAEPPLIARALARANDDWSEGWLLQVVTDFVERRVQAGEQPAAIDFERAVRLPDFGFVDSVVPRLEGALPAETMREYEQWRRVRTQTEYFGALGRIFDRERVPVLTTVGGRAAVVGALREALYGADVRSVVLVGEPGVGKSAVIYEALRPLRDEGCLIFEAGASDVMAGQQYIGQLEGRVHEIVERAAAGRRVIWVLPSFENTLWAGQHSRSPRGLLDALLPCVAAGQLTIVGELEPKAYELLLQQRPRVASVFETLRLEPLSSVEAIEVAKDWRDRAGANVDDATIGDAQDLAQHYLAAVAAPAGLLRLLKATVAGAGRDDRAQIRGEQVIETLSEATGLPLHVVDPEAPLDLDEVRSFFSTRVLGQPDAVDCLVDRIALVKANLTDPSRPLGVFLFVGPTGTGKTEIAKTLAEFLFGSPDRLVRLDMSEFQTENSFERLLADSSSNPEASTLISSVRAKPFSVVLLDEFEKAHRKFWSVFLQLFDDGRLTDRQGRTADFRQCVVIMTSNFGAAVESGKPFGFTGDGGPRFRPAAVEKALGRVFNPEFLNRIDRIVVFRPFERDQMRALLERELAQVLERRGFRSRPWAVEWDEAALEFLAEKGFSPELGARPLKRAVERYLLAPLAAAIVSRSFPEGEQFLFITAREDGIHVAFVDPDAEESEPVAELPRTSLRLEQLVLGPGGGAEERAFLQAETARLKAVIEGGGWLGRKELDLDAMRSEAFWDSPGRFAVLARIEYVDRVQAAFRTAEKLAARLSRLSRNGHGPARDLVELLAERLYLLDRACADADASDPSDAYLEIRAAGADRLEEDFAAQLRVMYEAWARRRGMRVQPLWSDGSHLLAVSGIGAHRILVSEHGLHVFESPQGEGSFDRVAVHVSVAPRVPAPPETDPLEQARQALAECDPSNAIVRRYRRKPSPLVRDSVRDWRTGRLDRVLDGQFDVMVEDER
jgi:ATP-dependent Clp protease ATP-binding subunit ClpC